MLGHRGTSSCGLLKKYEGVRKHYKGTVSTLLSERQRMTRARKVFPNIFSLIEVDSEGKKVGNTCSSPQFRKRNCRQFQNTVPDHSRINTRFSGEVHLRPNIFSLTVDKETERKQPASNPFSLFLFHAKPGWKNPEAHPEDLPPKGKTIFWLAPVVIGGDGGGVWLRGYRPLNLRFSVCFHFSICFFEKLCKSIFWLSDSNSTGSIYIRKVSI